MTSAVAEMGMTIAEIFRSKYAIPLYQRNFAWRTDEIQQLLQDIFDAYEKDRDGHYYIGSLVVLKRHTGEYEVIDGQQRLTVLSLIAAILKKPLSTVLFYDSRPEVQDFFNLLGNGKAEAAAELDAPSLFYLKDAYAFIQDAEVEKRSSNGEGAGNIKFLGSGIETYFWDHVVLVRNEMPDDTDVAAYFEIMNNRGEQLQKHEIVKAQMMSRIAEDGFPDAQQLFAKVWNACSQMDIPIHRLFSAADRRQFFGDNYDGFLHEPFHFDDASAIKRTEQLGFSLERILDDNQLPAVDINKGDKEDGADAETDVYAYRSIIDFPNFLMHVLRLYMSTQHPEAEVPLNEKDLLSVYNNYKARIDPIKFAELLLFCRAAFDGFVVKTSSDAHDNEDGQKWVLVRPKKYSNGSWKYTSSFDADAEGQLIKALSMLQVTYRQRINKSWLYAALEWLYRQCFCSGDFSSIKAGSYLKHLHGQMLASFNGLFADERGSLKIRKIADNEEISSDISYSEGTGTPHFLFNFIDYLYCRQNPDFLGSKRDNSLGHSGFDFKYWNSVEHHYAQKYAKDEDPQNYEKYINNLGNLCLVSRSANSRLSDRIVKEKVERCGKGNLGPNRQIIYSETQNAGGKWGEEQIRRHYNELVDLLNERTTLLGLDTDLPKA